MNWLVYIFGWYGVITLLGIVFFPITRILFRTWIDQGYAFAKIIALLIVGYVTFVLGDAHILPFTRTGLFVIIGAAICINGFVAIQLRKKTKPLHIDQLFWIIIEEILFIAGLVFLAYIRGQEPSIHSLEKFMDFGFINSILRTSYFPPKDMWYSADPTHPGGYLINYYYFGHLIGALLIKLANIAPAIGYNLILATILGLGLSASFSITINICSTLFIIQKKVLPTIRLLGIGLIGSFFVNLAGNLHTIYLFTSGYPADHPIPFWQILSGYNPTHYWYPNATRFIPYTIHEFPSYSYVVADLHGHVFDIPFVLLTIAILFTVFMSIVTDRHKMRTYYLSAAIIGMMLGIHYMTNALDGPIYFLLASLLFFMLFRLGKDFFIHVSVMFITFVITTLPFSLFFTPFASGIGVNCAPAFLTAAQRIGPFLFEKGNCQISPPWMLLVLWGFFWTHFIVLAFYLWSHRKDIRSTDLFILALFSLGTFLIFIPEFFYIKDIYPMHFRANTMFKLGYQAFIMMSIASAYTLFRVRPDSFIIRWTTKLVLGGVFFLVLLYPFYSFPSYYGMLNKPVQLDGSVWLSQQYPENKEIIDYINTHIQGQPVILEAQGDSYTDYDQISAFTGIPTVAGWWVHEWLWRDSPEAVGQRIPDIVSIYQLTDPDVVRTLLAKYHVKYVVISSLEKQKYQNSNVKFWNTIATPVFVSTNGIGALYQVK